MQGRLARRLELAADLTGRECEIEPARRAGEACYALRSFVESDPRGPFGYTRGNSRMGLACCTKFVKAFGKSFS